MKKFIVLILFIFMSLPCFAEKKINLFDMSNSQASKILYEFELKDMNVSREKAKEAFNYDQSDVYAIFYDLNSDGVNEIIGFINSTYFYCVQGYELFVLKKVGNEYKRITEVHFFPNVEFFILDSKTNGFHDLKVHHIKIKSIYEPEYHIKYSEAFSSVKYDAKEQYYKYFFPN